MMKTWHLLIETQVGDLNLFSDILGKIKKDLTTLAHKCGTHDIYRLLLLLYQILKDQQSLWEHSLENLYMSLASYQFGL